MISTCPNCGQRNRVPPEHLLDRGKCGKCKAALPPVSSPIDVDPAQFDSIVAAASVPVLVDFWAAWCGPCRMAAPELERVAQEMAGRALVLKVDTQQHPQLAARYGVRGIPHFMVLSGGEPVLSQAGLVDHRQMRAWLQQAA